MKKNILSAKRLGSWVLLALFLVSLAAVLAGCSTPEGGSSMPWAQPEPWEQQPRLGVPY